MREERARGEKMATWFSGSGDIDVRLRQREEGETEPVQIGSEEGSERDVGEPYISETETRVLGAGWRLSTCWPSGPSCPHWVWGRGICRDQDFEWGLFRGWEKETAAMGVAVWGCRLGTRRRTARHGLFSPGLTAAVSQGTRWNNEVRFSQHRSYPLGAKQVLLDTDFIPWTTRGPLRLIGFVTRVQKEAPRCPPQLEPGTCPP